MEDYKLAVVLWKVLQDWLAKNSWETEDDEEEREEGLEEEKPFPIAATLLLVHLANKGIIIHSHICIHLNSILILLLLYKFRCIGAIFLGQWNIYSHS